MGCSASVGSGVLASGWAVAGAQRPKAAPVKGRILPSPSQITRAYPPEFPAKSRQSAVRPIRPAQFDPKWPAAPASGVHIGDRVGEVEKILLVHRTARRAAEVVLPIRCG